MGIEPTYSAWKAEVLPLNYTRLFQSESRQSAHLTRRRVKQLSNMVEGEGFEPSKHEATDLQSVGFDRSPTPPNSQGRTFSFSICTVSTYFQHLLKKTFPTDAFAIIQ